MEFTDEKLKEIHARALKQFEAIQERERDSRALAVEDLRFVNVEGAQWEDSFDKREDMPRFEINRVAGAIDQVVGDQRQQRAGITYIPTSAEADDDIAEIYSGIARDIQRESQATTIYDASFDEMTTGGYGGWRILTEYEDDGFDQCIKIAPIISPTTSLYFGESTRYDKRDATHAFLVTSKSVDAFKEEYPDASLNEFPRERYTESYHKDWFSGTDDILLGEYWWKEPKNRTIAELSDGRVIDLEEEKDVLDEIAETGVEIKRTRTVKSHTVYMLKMNVAEVLSKPKKWAGKYIPLVPEYGKITNIEGKTYIRGLTRFSKDPQRIYNHETSNAVLIGAEQLDDPYWITATQADGYEDQLQSYKTKRSPFMLYNHDADEPGPPKRTGAPSVQQAQMERIRQAEMDIYATNNIYPTDMGHNVSLQSGVAIKRQDEKGDRGSYVFQDNHRKSIEYTGEIIQDLIPKIYDRPDRVIKITGLDGKVETEVINKIQRDILGIPMVDRRTGKEIIVNDLKAGRYGTVVDTAPAYSTQKEESFAQLLELVAVDERFKVLSTDLIAKNLNAIEADTLYKRIRRQMVIEGVIEPTEEEVEEYGLGQQKPDPQSQALTDNVNMDTVKKQSEIELNDAKKAQIVIETQAKAIKAYEDMMKALGNKVDTGLPITRDDLMAMSDTLAMVEISQGAVQPS